MKKFIAPMMLSCLMIVVLAQQSLPAGQIIIDTITSEALRGNKLGDPDTRNMAIYLPPSYDESDYSYPVIYLLHGFGGDEGSFVGELGDTSTVDLLDLLIGVGLLKEAIIVLPDGSNKYGGSYYLNSELIGNYEDYIAYDLVNFIDENYRTIPDRSGRIIGGASMGGYGCISLAMKHPEIFSAVASMSPPLGFDVIAEMMIPEVVAENPNGMTGPGPDAGQFTSYMYALSAALSPNLDNPPYFVDMPFEYPNLEIIESVRQRWLVGDPITMLNNDSSSLKKMSGIYIDVGTEDLPGFKQAADAFHQALVEMNIQHEYNVYEGDHYAKEVERATSSLTFISALLPTATTGVRHDSKLAITWGAMKR